MAGLRWSPSHARDVIAQIGRDADDAFDRQSLWPVHPLDEEPGGPADGVMRGLYLGAAGMLHAFWRLAAAGLYETRLDCAEIALELYEPSLLSPDEDGAGASLLLGTTGILLAAHWLAPSRALSEALADAIASNVEHPSNELLLGAPGTMIAARAMHDRNGEERFAQLWRAAARVLLARQEPDGLWTQHMYGRKQRHLGAGHGFAGNVLALHAGAQWLDAGTDAGLTATTVSVIRAQAVLDNGRANWPPVPGAALTRVQWCHGAPGIVTSLARVAPGDPLHTELLTAAGQLIWEAGPIKGNAGLCHGTAGNGFAFLALLARTGDELWLSRARTFAMHALAQVQRSRAAAGRGRYSLFTGDIGAALLAASCITVDPAFPGLDDL